MPGIVGLFSDRQLTRESESIFSTMVKRLSHLGPLREFSFELLQGTVRIGLLTDDPCFTADYEGFQLLAFSQTTKDEDNQDLIVECLKDMKIRDGSSPIPQMLIAVGVTESELRVVRTLDGLRPLYFSKMQNKLVFSSEQKAIWAYASATPESLHPGNVLRLSAEKGMEIIPVYSQSRPPSVPESKQEDHLATLRKFLKQSFLKINKMRKCSVLFSGGVDSSLAALLAKEANLDPLLISVATPESKDFEKTKTAASALSLDHELVLLDTDSVWEILPEVIYAIESNNRMDVEIALPFFLAAKKARALDYEAVVSGQGPDELFAGYARYERAFQEKGIKAVADELWSDYTKTHETNIARDTKAIEYHGVRSFFPFLDVKFSQAALASPVGLLINPNSNPSRKILFRTLAKKMGLATEMADAQKHATQYSSGSSKVLQEAVVKFVSDTKGFNRREIILLVKDVLQFISREIGMPTSESKEIEMDMQPTDRLIEKVGQLATRYLG
ncbi:MAG: asparagine synthase C-terminal domain-containing protein [Candidatus Thorarchaeota archaeon]|jgi:asparagine synthase (glutamine-hydrolysing)